MSNGSQDPVGSAILTGAGAVTDILRGVGAGTQAQMAADEYMAGAREMLEQLRHGVVTEREAGLYEQQLAAQQAQAAREARERVERLAAEQEARMRAEEERLRRELEQRAGETAGPLGLPTWGWALIGIGTLGVVGLAVYAIVKR